MIATSLVWDITDIFASDQTETGLTTTGRHAHFTCIATPPFPLGYVPRMRPVVWCGSILRNQCIEDV
ncbi:hypothetical protein N7510_008960 [Penicillium lagena]|uniref:uncharacterized protein n=1 Tax=Penicillium lagena TaxID=94218 RepID=UPI00253F7729|nr:uncharacterized protein N7510_008960 [Penicillium lagena]KAJ5606179.1 hypothetical protein N7510_008960 [Penicillium lagena]